MNAKSNTSKSSIIHHGQAEYLLISADSDILPSPDWWWKFFLMLMYPWAFTNKMVFSLFSVAGYG
jgi:hypothetical protein